MAKVLKQDPITRLDIEEYLAKYSDFAFEIKTLNLLTSHGYKCKHSGTYTDPVTQKTREYDIRAEINRNVTASLTLNLLFAIECKNLKENFPLVVHCMPRSRHEEKEEMILSYRNEIEEMLEGLLNRHFDSDNPYYNATTIQLHHTLSIYNRDEPVGKSCDQIGRVANNNDVTGSDSDVFDKISQAINSSYDLIYEAVRHGSRYGYSLSIIKPILVVPDNTLWHIIYDTDGKIAVGPEQVQYAAYYYGKTWPYTDSKKAKEYTISHLDIVTFGYLQDHIRSILAFENEDLVDDLKRQKEAGLIAEEVKI